MRIINNESFFFHISRLCQMMKSLKRLFLHKHNLTQVKPLHNPLKT